MCDAQNLQKESNCTLRGPTASGIVKQAVTPHWYDVGRTELSRADKKLGEMMPVAPVGCM